MPCYTIEELRARKTNALTALQALTSQENTAWAEYIRLKEARLAAAKAYEEAVRAVQKAEAYRQEREHP